MEGITHGRLGESAWREFVARHASGGESVSEFCRREGLTANSFRRWRVQLASIGVETRRRESVCESSALSAQAFVDLGMLAGAPWFATGPGSVRNFVGEA